MVQTIIFNAYERQRVGDRRSGIFETARMAVDTKGIVERVNGISPARIYRKELKVYRRMAQVIDRHQTLSNLWIGGWIFAGIVTSFFFA